MAKPRIYADFHNADPSGRLRLNCVGTLEDLSREKVELREGADLIVYSEELEADGVAHFSATESIWVAAIDWKAVRNQAEGTPCHKEEDPARTK